MASTSPIPITIITGFLGSGKTTLILNLIPQLPPTYRLALIKNEFGDVAVDSQLASTKSITGVKELLNGCICCNLIGSLEDALSTLSEEQNPDRFIIETSGSAFPATLAMEVNRLARETGRYALDGVVSVIDVENWTGYEDTSYTAKIQARYTDLLILNKWELVSERVFEDCVDRILDLDLDLPTPRAKSDKGWVDKDLLLGLDAKLAKITAHGKHQKTKDHGHGHEHAHEHEHSEDHSSEVDVLSITLRSTGSEADGIDLDKLEGLLAAAPKDEVYRIKAILYSLEAPASSTGEKAEAPANEGAVQRYILNWAFGRWTFTASTPSEPGESDEETTEPVLRMTIVTAKHDGKKWEKRTQSGEFLSLSKNPQTADLVIKRIS
jgi:G3E family GTPase